MELYCQTENQLPPTTNISYTQEAKSTDSALDANIVKYRFMNYKSV
jgi:hypothetical protein